MWIEAWERTGLSIRYTFSEMLAINTYVQTLYICWCVIYSIIVFSIIGLCVKYYWKGNQRSDSYETNEGEVRERHICCKNSSLDFLYIVFTILYIIFSIVKLTGIIGLFFFNVNDPSQSTSHYVFAALAFGFSVACVVLLFVRRVIVYIMSETPNLPLYFYIFDGLWSVTVVALASVLIGIRTGEYEFTVSLMVVLDPSWQIADFMSEKNFVKMYYREGKTAKISLNLKKKDYYIKKFFSYNKNHIY
jgi:hypothetical protein